MVCAYPPAPSGHVSVHSALRHTSPDVPNDCPRMVTMYPPAEDPCSGDTDVTTGGSYTKGQLLEDWESTIRVS